MQPSRYLLAMGASNNPGERLQGVDPPVDPGSDDLAIIDLLQEYIDIFTDPVFPLPDWITNGIGLLDKNHPTIKT